MIITETKLKGAFIIDVQRIEDDRGFFGRTYCKKEFEAYGINTNVVQTNVSYNRQKGTLRGLHMQMAPYSETKLVRCTRGAIFDVIVDMRSNSDTFKQWTGVELSSDNYRMLYVPEDFAHGFMTLTDNTDVTYQVTQFYTPEAERGYRWNDPTFGIIWPFEPLVLSHKDQTHPFIEAEITCLK